MHTVRPNFFIIGAPRCGTTALSEYLRGHPKIGFSIPKETQFFCTDFPDIRLYREEKSYLINCYRHCVDQDCAAIGEGSVWHLYSEEAVSNILRFEPSAKFIVMVRNPLDMAISLYEKWYELLWEDQTDFENAWHLQDARKKGMNVPKYCREPKLLNYGDVCKLGSQLERLYCQIPETQRMVVVFDDFIQRTKEVYTSVLEFLEVEDDHRTYFPIVNEGKRVRFRKLAEFSYNPPLWALKGANAFKTVFGIERLNIIPKLRSLSFAVRKSKPPISSSLRKEMRQFFSDDLHLLSSLLKRDLSSWG